MREWSVLLNKVEGCGPTSYFSYKKDSRSGFFCVNFVRYITTTILKKHRLKAASDDSRLSEKTTNIFFSVHLFSFLKKVFSRTS